MITFVAIKIATKNYVPFTYFFSPESKCLEVVIFSCPAGFVVCIGFHGGRIKSLTLSDDREKMCQPERIFLTRIGVMTG